MSARDDAEKVKRNITSIYERRRAAVFALSLEFAAKALNDFRQRQSSGEFWTNRSNVAKDTVFSDAFLSDNIVGWFMAHSVEYGVYLELANNRQNEALRPIIRKWVKPFRKELKALYA